jgi:23S rRNA (cytosine1962-C5)-methyltransferase
MHTISIITPDGWSDYQLLDSGDGERLEQFGEFVIARPDPQILWSKSLPHSVWRTAQAVFERTYEDKGAWQTFAKMPEEWPVHWQDLTFMARLSPFKHTGIFPEQSAHWAWFRELIVKRVQLAQEGAAAVTADDGQPKVLNLFAYTGGASIVAAKAGAKVTHVDASRASIGWAKKNQLASGLDERSIRWILEDVVKFVEREVRRGATYDGIIMDPPVYGHGPNGEKWDFKKSLPILLEMCSQILTDKPLFILINAYAVSTSAVTLGNLLTEMLGQRGGEVRVGELALEEAREAVPQETSDTTKAKSNSRLLSTGIWARWCSE